MRRLAGLLAVIAIFGTVVVVALSAGAATSEGKQNPNVSLTLTDAIDPVTAGESSAYTFTAQNLSAKAALTHVTLKGVATAVGS